MRWVGPGISGEPRGWLPGLKPQTRHGAIVQLGTGQEMRPICRGGWLQIRACPGFSDSTRIRKRYPVSVLEVRYLHLFKLMTELLESGESVGTIAL